MDWQQIPTIESEYAYSEPHYIRKWSGGGYISVKVGYVKKHPDQNVILYFTP